MATTKTFLSSGTFVLTGSHLGQSVTIECYGAGGRGSKLGNGGAGGGYSKAIVTLPTGSYSVGVGENDFNGYGNGGDTWFKSGSNNIIICQAGGGNQDGTIDNQLTSATGSTVYYGGHGCPDFKGYSSYNGSGGGGGASSTANGQNGQSAYYSTEYTPASGGYSVAGGNGGAGGFYYAGAGANRVVVPKAGKFPGGGGGGAYDYGTAFEAFGGNGACYITVP
jgi:hypothetical protein